MQTTDTAAENKRLMTELFEAVARGERTKFAARLAEDIVFTVTGECSWSGVYRGRDTVARYFGLLAELAPGERRTVPFRILADEDWVVVEARGEMVSRAGQPYRNHYCLMYRLRDGMIVEMKEYMDTGLCERVLGRFPAERMQD